MGWSSSWLGRSPVVRTVLRVETGEEEDDTSPALAELEVTTRHFCLAACWAFARVAISSSCRGTCLLYTSDAAWAGQVRVPDRGRVQQLLLGSWHLVVGHNVIQGEGDRVGR